MTEGHKITLLNGSLSRTLFIPNIVHPLCNPYSIQHRSRIILPGEGLSLSKNTVSYVIPIVVLQHLLHMIGSNLSTSGIAYFSLIVSA